MKVIAWTIVACSIIGSFSNVHGGSSRLMRQRTTAPACGTVTGFSVFNPHKNTRTPLVKTITPSEGAFDRIILEDFKDGKFNIAATVQQDSTCQVKCVRLSIIDTLIRGSVATERIDTVAPYEFFSMPQTIDTGMFNISATSYADVDCAGTPYSTDQMQIQILEKRVVTSSSRRLTIYYNGTSNSAVTARETKAMIQATCSYMEAVFRYTAIIQDGCIILTDYKCRGVSSQTSQPGPLAITYRLGTTYTLGPISLVENGNFGFFTNDVLTTYFQVFLQDFIPTPFCWECEPVLMSEEIKRQIGPSNPYSLYNAADVLMTTRPFSDKFELSKFNVVYDGTDAASGNFLQRKEVVTATCQFIVDTVIDHFRYDNYRVSTECRAITISTRNGDLQITYDVTPTFANGPELTIPFQDFPPYDSVLGTVQDIFTDVIGLPIPGNNDDDEAPKLFLSTYLKQTLSETNPYITFTKIILK
jgi:hypothetical protein